MTGQSDSHHIHTTDPASLVRAVAADLEYYRTKRLEPRVLNFVRRGVVTFHQLMQAGRGAGSEQLAEEPPSDLEQRIRVLEDRLDALVTGIATVTVPVRSADFVIDDIRRERGDYDGFFRIAKRTYPGSLEEQMARLELQLSQSEELLDVFTRALLAAGEVTQEQLQQSRQVISNQGYRNGARLVARAWADPAFKQRLLEIGRDVARELDIPPGRLGKLGVAENTDREHNVVVCTLCSCYPHDLLGDPPWWYRIDEYKQRIIDDPRTMLREMFGLELPVDRSIVVRDSTSDIRWMVLPRRPEGTEDMSEAELAHLVTPESLVGVAEARVPSARV